MHHAQGLRGSKCLPQINKFFPTCIFAKFTLIQYRNLSQRKPLLDLCKSWWTTQQHSMLASFSLSLHGAFPHHVKWSSLSIRDRSRVKEAQRAFHHSPSLLLLFQLALSDDFNNLVVLKSNMILQRMLNQRRGIGLIDDSSNCYCQLAICGSLNGREMPPLQKCILIASTEAFLLKQVVIAEILPSIS